MAVIDQRVAAGEKEMGLNKTGLALHIITEQIEEAIAAPKCHKCGCLQQTVEALSETEAGKNELATTLDRAHQVFVPKKYDCLGCPVCYPAIAANAFAEAYPEAGKDLDLCPTEEQEEREGWPPFPGDYSVIRYEAPVAVCALNSESLVKDLVDRRPEGLAIAGTMHTENLGIERVIKNTLANPNIRFMVLCGEDTQRAIGHLPGQSFESLFRNGMDERNRIIGAKGKRPVLKNVSQDEIQAFLSQVELVTAIGIDDPDEIGGIISACAERNPGPDPKPFKAAAVERIHVSEAKRLVLDKAGYFVICPDKRTKRLVVEHYTNQGVLTCILEGESTGALYGEVIERQLITRLDHAAYLGRELARAEMSMMNGTSFVQDAAPGEPGSVIAPDDTTEATCGCSSVMPKGRCQ